MNGHVYRNADVNNWGTTWAQRPLLFHIIGGKSLDPVPAVEGTTLATPMPSRGLAVGDLFNDGKMDAVVNNIDASPALLRNMDANHNHRLGTTAGGWTKESKGWHRSDHLSHCQWNDVTRRCVFWRQLRLDIGYATSLWPRAGDQRGKAGGSVAKRQHRAVPGPGCRPVFNSDRGPGPRHFGWGGKSQNTTAETPICLVPAVFWMV